MRHASATVGAGAVRMSKFILIPAVVASIWISCTRDEQGPDLPTRATDIRLSASMPTDIDGLTGVSLKLTPARYCDGSWADVDDNELPSYVEDLDVAQMVWPSGDPISSAPDQQARGLAEVRFIDVVPGCYDVIAAPLAIDGEPLANCHARTVPITVDPYTSLVVDLPILCGEPPREQVDGNYAPSMQELTVEPQVSACELAKVCATASDPDDDMLVFEWQKPAGLDQEAITAVWPTVVEHHVNLDRSVTQCIGVQAHQLGMYDITVDVYDVVRPDPHEPPVHIEDGDGMAESHANASVKLAVTAGCTPAGRSAVIMLTLNDNPGLPMAYARTLIGNTVLWATKPIEASPAALVVLDDNHRGEDSRDGEFVHAQLEALEISADFMLEPSGGLTTQLLEPYDLVWLVNPSYEVDDDGTHTTLLRYRKNGGAVVLQGNDIARFRGNPRFMEPLTYLSWQGNGTIACGALIDDSVADTYTVEMTELHPILTGLRGVSFEYGNDIDSTLPLGRGEQVLAWASHETADCAVRIPVVVALDPGELSFW
jgi:hypothetical protein